MKDVIQEHIMTIQSIEASHLLELEKAIEASVNSLKSNGKILFCGNGGSAADAQHLAAEFVVRFRENRPALAALSLATDTSALTACGNDFSYEEIFSRQVEAIGNEGDVLFAISTSGNSPNVVKVAEVAKDKGLKVISITGSKECKLDGLADICLKMPSDVTARIQECYMLLGHILCGEVEKRVFSS